MTTRNIFVAGLAVSDLLLCSLTMPLTAADLALGYWSVRVVALSSV